MAPSTIRLVATLLCALSSWHEASSSPERVRLAKARERAAAAAVRAATEEAAMARRMRGIVSRLHFVDDVSFARLHRA